MEPTQAMLQEMAITRTVVADALASRCVQHAAEIALLTERVNAQAAEIAELKKLKAETKDA